MTTAAQNFGTYMRILRERAGLSRPDACRLVTATHEALDRGSLWRFEKGEHGLSVGKLGTLARIYGVPLDVIFERWELDRDCEKNAPAGREAIARILDEGRQALAGAENKWLAYRSFRQLLETHDGGEDRLAARLNLATSMRSLGKNLLALHELRLLESDAWASPLYPVVLDRIANCHRCLGNMNEAEAVLGRALEAAAVGEDHRIIGVVHSSRANVAIDFGEPQVACERLRRAIEAGRRSANGALKPSPGLEGTLLNMLADVHLALGENDAAFEAAKSAGRIGRRYQLPTCIAYSELMLGRLADRAGREAVAERHWRDVDTIGLHTKNGRLRFAGGFYLYRRLVRKGETSRVRTVGRRLDRLRVGLPPHYPLVPEFLDLASRSRARGKRRIPRSRRGPVTEA